MKKVVILIALILIMSSNCVAMTFSQPMQIGKIMYPPNGDMVIENATYTSSKPTGKFQNLVTYPYNTVIKFSNEENSIYVHHKSGYKEIPYFGDENIENSIQIETGLYGVNIFQLKNDGSIKLYLLQTQEASANFVNWVCIGKKDEKWIKYFDIRDIRKQYFGENNWRYYTFALYLEKITYDKYTYPIIYCKDDTIIIEYQKSESNINGYTKGEFKFKWDDKAQWFGIEQVVY